MVVKRAGFGRGVGGRPWQTFTISLLKVTAFFKGRGNSILGKLKVGLPQSPAKLKLD